MGDGRNSAETPALLGLGWEMDGIWRKGFLKSLSIHLHIPVHNWKASSPPLRGLEWEMDAIRRKRFDFLAKKTQRILDFLDEDARAKSSKSVLLKSAKAILSAGGKLKIF